MTIAAAILCFAVLCCAIRLERLQHLKRGKAIPRRELLSGVDANDAKTHAETDAKTNAGGDETVVFFDELSENDIAQGIQRIIDEGDSEDRAEFIASVIQSDREEYSEGIRQNIQNIASQVYQSNEMRGLFFMPFEVSWFQTLPLIFDQVFALEIIKRDLDFVKSVSNSLFDQIEQNESIPPEFRTNIRIQHDLIAGHMHSIQKICHERFGDLWDVMGIVGFPMDDLSAEIFFEKQNVFFQVEDDIFAAVQSTIEAIRKSVAEMADYSEVRHITQLQTRLNEYALLLEQLMPFPTLDLIHEARNGLGSAPVNQVQQYFQNSFKSIFTFTFIIE